MSKPKKASLSFWSLFGLILFFYGFLSFEAGVKTSPFFNKSGDLKNKTTKIIEMAEAGEQIENEKLIQEVSPFWMTILSKISSQKYAFGRDGILHVDEYYYSIPDKKRAVISTHMMLGILLLVTGFFQFWPAFRRKYRSLHRYFGIIYMVTTVISMTLSIKHLLYAGPANIFSTFVFYVGLFMLAISEFICIGMALYALYKKDFAVHMGWMALSFGFYLTAPVQRLNWFALSLFATDTTFMETNILVNVSLQSQVILIAYLLFHINRRSSPIKAIKFEKQLTNTKKSIYTILSYGGLLFMIAIFFRYFALGPGLASNENFSSLIPDGILNHQSLIYSSSFLPLLFFGGTTILLLTALRLITTTPEKVKEMKLERTLLIFCSLLVSIILLYWGYQLGMPTYELSVAGAGYFQTGVFLLLFLGLCLRALSKKKFFLVQELLRFVMAVAITPAMVYVLLYIFDWFNVVPIAYIKIGHAFELAHLLSMTLPLITVFIMTFYSSTTKRFAIY